MTAELSPFKRAILDAVVGTTARWLIAQMRRLEEATLDADARWNLLRERIEHIARRAEKDGGE